MREPDLVGWSDIPEQVSAQVLDSFEHGIPTLIHSVGESGAGRSRLIREVYQSVAVASGWPPLETSCQSPMQMELMRSEIAPRSSSTELLDTGLLYFPVTIGDAGQSVAAMTQAANSFSDFLASIPWSARSVASATARETGRQVMGAALDPPRVAKVLLAVGKSTWTIYNRSRPDEMERLSQRVSSDLSKALRSLAREHAVLVCIQGGVVDPPLAAFIGQLVQRSRSAGRPRLAVLATSADPDDLLSAFNPITYRLPLLHRPDAEAVAATFEGHADIEAAESPPGAERYAPRDVVHLAVDGDRAVDRYLAQLERLDRKNPEAAEATALMVASRWASPEPADCWPGAIQRLVVPALEGLDRIGWWCGRWDPNSGWPLPRELQESAARRFVMHRPALKAELKTLAGLATSSPARVEDREGRFVSGSLALDLREAVETDEASVHEAILALSIPWLPRAMWHRPVREHVLTQMFDHDAVNTGLCALGLERGIGGMTNGPFTMVSADVQFAFQTYARSERELTARMRAIIAHVVSLPPENVDDAISLLAACQQVTGAPPWRAIALSFQILFDEGMATDLDGMAAGFGSGPWQRSAAAGCAAVSALVREDFIGALGFAQDAADILIGDAESESSLLTVEVVPFVAWLCKVHVMSGTFHPSLETLLNDLWTRRDEMTSNDTSVVRRYQRTSLRWRAGSSNRNKRQLEALRLDAFAHPAENESLRVVEEMAFELETRDPRATDIRGISTSMALTTSESEIGRLGYEAANDRAEWSTVFDVALRALRDCDDSTELQDVASRCIDVLVSYLGFNVLGIGDCSWPSPPSSLASGANELVEALVAASDTTRFHSVTALGLASCATLLSPSADNLKRLAAAIQERLPCDPLDHTGAITEGIRHLLGSTSHRTVGATLVREWWTALEAALDIAGPRPAAVALHLGWSLLADEAQWPPRERRSLARKVCPRTFGWLLTALRPGGATMSGVIPAWPASFEPPPAPVGIRLQ